MVSGAAGGCDVEVNVVVVVCKGPIFLIFRVGEKPKGKRGRKNRITGTVSTLDNPPFSFVLFIGIVDEQAIFDDVAIVLPREAWDGRLVRPRLDPHDASQGGEIGSFQHANERK